LLLPAAIVAIIAVGITLLFGNLAFFSLIELKGLDLLFTLRGNLSPPDQIVIVAIDETSMAEIKQQWPWPRSLHAQLLRQLHKAGAKVIGIDVLFAEPSEPAEDQALTDALRDVGNVVLVSALAVENDPLYRYTLRIDPLPAFRDVAVVGNPLIRIDADGIVRRTRILAPDMPSFALQIVRHYLEGSAVKQKIAPELQRFSQKVLLQDVLINYPGPPKTVKTVSYYQALDYERLLPPGIFTGKIVLIGRALEVIPEPQRLSGDTFLTPFSWIVQEPAAGVEIQANIISNLLEGRFVSELSGAPQWVLLLSLISAASLILVRLRPLTGLITTLTLAGLSFATALLVFTQTSVWLPVISGILALILVYGGHLLVRMHRAEQERRRMLEDLNRELESKITERTQELSLTHQELSQRHQQLETAYQELTQTQEQLIQSEKMASLGLLVAGVAHELNNPVSYVDSNLEFIEEYAESLAGVVKVCTTSCSLSDQNGRPNPAQVETLLQTLRELIASSREGTERIKKIVLDLRVFSRTDDQGLMTVDLHDGLESTLNLLAKEYRDRITVHRAYGNLPRVECYPGQINQVFMNLLQNAAQSIPGRGEVWITTETAGTQVSINIRDNGAGIAESDLARIFDPFFTTKPVGSGTGLGLSISYGIIERHGGKMQVHSQVNEGTTLIIQLPVRHR
jgi:signal transduction histidine kinase